MPIRLICSDIDGTLLQYGRKELEGEIFEQIRELHRRGILFCPASGRQYTSLRKLFAPVADCCVFLCENGGVIYKDEQCIAKNPMPRALAEEIANDLWTRSDGQGEVMLSGQNTAYLMERGLGMLQRIQFIGNNYQIIHDPSEVPEEITKVSVYLHEGVGEQSSHKTVFAKVPAMGQIWRDFGHAFSFASSSSRGMYPSPSYLIWMCCTRFPLDLSGAST